MAHPGHGSARDRLRTLAARVPRRFAGAVAGSPAGAADGPTAATEGELVPLSVDGRFTFLYEPDWSEPEVEQVVRSYVAAFHPKDRTTLVLPVLAGGPA